MLLFSVEKNFRKENIQFSSRSFFPFPETAHDAPTYARAYCRNVSALNNAFVCASPWLRSQRLRVRIPLSALFFTSFQILVNAFLIFNTKKTGVFRQNLGLFDK